MQNGTSNDTDNGLLKTEKEKYVRSVTNVPEFDQAVSHLSQITMKQGSQIDKDNMDSIVKKIHLGNLTYDDVGKLETVCDNNFKYLFSAEPEKRRIDVTIWSGALLVACAVVLRLCYESDENQTLMIFLSLINLLGVAYTIISWPTQTVNIVEAWLQDNNIPGVFASKIISEVNRKIITCIVGIAVVVLIWLVVTWYIGLYALGNDIISIASLGASILEDRIVNLFARHYEWKIYHNNT